MKCKHCGEEKGVRCQSCLELDTWQGIEHWIEVKGDYLFHDCNCNFKVVSDYLYNDISSGIVKIEIEKRIRCERCGRMEDKIKIEHMRDEDILLCGVCQSV